MTVKGQHTNFQAFKRQARKNSAVLNLAFIVGIILSSFSYFFATLLVVRHTDLGILISMLMFSNKNEGKSSSLADESITLSMVVALISMAVVLIGFFLKRKELQDQCAYDIASSLGAQRLPSKQSFQQKRYVNVVEEMAIASGLDCPLIMYLPKDDSINGFVTGGADESVTITVSQGALEYLKREELQALVAHEFGHIFNRDVFLNNRLTAVLHGFFAIQSLVTAGDRRESFDYLSYAVMTVSCGSIFFGKLLKAAFSRQREWLADAHAVQYTRNKDALIGVFSKAMALQEMTVETPKMLEENTHFLFINYQNKWLSTHPPLDARMGRYGCSLSQDDLEAIVYRLKQQKIDEKKLAEKKQGKKKTGPMMTAGGGLLGLAPLSEESTEMNENLQDAAIKFIPLMVLREYQKNLRQQPAESPNAAANAILAQFIMLSDAPVELFANKFKWAEDQQKAITKEIEHLDDQHPSTHIQSFLHHLRVLPNYNEKKKLVNEIYYIIKADKSFGLCEMSYLLCLQSTLHKRKPKDECTESYQEHIDSIKSLLMIFAYISHAEDKGREANFKLMIADAIPSSTEVYVSPNLDVATVQKLYNNIRELSSVTAPYRKLLIGVIEKNILIDKKISTEQNHLLSAIKSYLG